jgi:uncharacterized membrane protein YfcA
MTADAIGQALHGALSDPRFPIIAVVALVCGIVRGFSGFGVGMIFMPAASVLYGPRTTVAALWIMDSLPGLAIAVPALRHVEWKTVLPVTAGNAVFVHAGVLLRKSSDPQILRWFISVAVFVFVFVLWSRWRYSGSRPLWLSAGVGGVAGLFGGAAQIPIPPVLAYWMASDAPREVTRANLIAFLMMAMMLTGIALFGGGLFTGQAVAIGVVIAPAYLAGLLIGARFFHSATDSSYRRAAFIIILASAVAGLPLFDALRD